MSATKGYRLDYFGDDIPEYLTTRAARLIVELNYSDQEEALERLENGLPVPVHAGVITCKAMMVS